MKKIILILTLLLYLSPLVKTQNSLPYTSPFRSLSGNDITVIQSSPGLPTVDPNGNGIILTNGFNQFSALYFSDLAFTTSKGFIIKFSFNVYEGDFGTVHKYADGFTLMLFDAMVPPDNISAGAKGSGLGYSYSRGSIRQNGLSGAYLGLGFDTYGGFKNKLLTTDDYRTGIQFLSNSSYPELGDNITLRGPYNNNAGTIVGATHPYQTGYPVLFSQCVSSVNAGFILNTTTGTYNISAPARLSSKPFSSFSLYTPTSTTISGTTNYRDATIKLIPGTNPKNSLDVGFFLTVNITHGLTSANIIDDYFLSSTTPITYPEISGAYPQTATTVNKTLSLSPPESLRLGFSASTGAGMQKVQIRDVSISLPYSPETNASESDPVCCILGYDSFLTGNLIDAVGYKTNIYTPTNPPVSSTDYLDYNSFVFKKYNSSTNTFTTSDEANGKQITTSYGVYTYSVVFNALGKTEPKIKFSPRVSLGNNASTLSDDLFYTINNNKVEVDTRYIPADLSAAEYTSAVTPITVLFTDCTPVKVNSFNFGYKK